MRGVLVVIAFFLAGLAAMFGLMVWSIRSEPDQSALRSEVVVAVLESQEKLRATSTSGDGYQVKYAYQVAGTWYGYEQLVPAVRWSPGDPLLACVDPDSPAEHTLHLVPQTPCGDYVGRLRTATPIEGAP